MNNVLSLAVDLTERGWLPDRLVRRGIRRLLRERLAAIRADDCERSASDASRFVAAMRGAPVAPLPEMANQQHYEVPSAFFELVLGRHRKYSCCHWGEGVRDLDAAEASALALTAERAEIEDGMQILELGCGWGSLTLWLAERFPGAAITAVSNSGSQRVYIEDQAQRRGLGNVTVITADMNGFTLGRRVDRVVSVEMFEHMRNYEALFERVAGWLEPDGRFFMHIFCHRAVPYAFEVEDASDWMSRYFFSGGIMPSDDLPLRFQRDLRLVDQWRWSGLHYQRTAEAWLVNMDARRDAVMPILREVYGAAQAHRWWVRWRLFFAACAELFGYDRGQQWWVSHYAFRPRG